MILILLLAVVVGCDHIVTSDIIYIDPYTITPTEKLFFSFGIYNFGSITRLVI